MPPVVIAAGIGAAAGIGGAVMSSKAQKKAAKSAANTATNTAAANNALAREQQAFAAQRLDPYAQRGNAAGDAINALLGIGGSQVPSQGTAQYGQPILAQQAPMTEEWANGALSSMGLGSRGNSVTTLQAHLAGQLEGQLPAYVRQAYNAYQQNNPMPQTAPAQTAPAGGNNALAPAQNAFQNYLGSTGYQFQVDEGNKAINQGYAAKGSLQSGAALKALQTYGQNTATGFFKDYLGLLSNQQGVGLSGASAVAGVGQNYVNNVSANNNNASAQQIAAYGQKANAASDVWGSVAGGITGVANAYGSSYRR